MDLTELKLYISVKQAASFQAKVAALEIAG